MQAAKQSNCGGGRKKITISRASPVCESVRITRDEEEKSTCSLYVERDHWIDVYIHIALRYLYNVRNKVRDIHMGVLFYTHADIYLSTRRQSAVSPSSNPPPDRKLDTTHR